MAALEMFTVLRAKTDSELISRYEKFQRELNKSAVIIDRQWMDNIRNVSMGIFWYPCDPHKVVGVSAVKSNVKRKS